LWLYYIVDETPVFFAVLYMDILVWGIDQIRDIDIAERAFKGGDVKYPGIEI
jgi:hypothetical protein